MRRGGGGAGGRPAWSTLKRTLVSIEWTVTARTDGAVADRAKRA